LSSPEARAAYQRLGSKLCPLQLRHTYRHKRTVTEGLAREKGAVATCRVILPGGRDLQQPWSLCAEAEASRDTFSALDCAALGHSNYPSHQNRFSYLSVATSASGQTLQKEC